MTQEDFYSSIAQPMRLTSSVVENLEQELEEYPYFEAGWMLVLKGMSDLGETNYDSALHRGAVSISNRNALFSLIRSKSETPEPEAKTEAKKLVPVDVISEHQSDMPAADNLSWAVADYEYDLSSGLSRQSASMPYSIDYIAKSVSDSDNCEFSDWLDYMDKKPSAVMSKPKSEQIPATADRRQNTRSRSLDLIESFLNNENAEVIRRKGEPVKKEVVLSKPVDAHISADNDDILTETLAKIYIKQQQYDKAIDIFRKLGLKYPEKSSYFASHINELENK